MFVVSPLAVDDSDMEREEAPSFIMRLQPMTVLDGDHVTLTCVTRGNPMPEINWFHNSVCVDNNEDFVITYDKRTGKVELYIVETFTEDSGVFKCIATSELGQAITMATLLVKEPSDDSYPNTETDAPTNETRREVREQIKLAQFKGPIVEYPEETRKVVQIPVSHVRLREYPSDIEGPIVSEVESEVETMEVEVKEYIDSEIDIRQNVDISEPVKQYDFEESVIDTRQDIKIKEPMREFSETVQVNTRQRPIIVEIQSDLSDMEDVIDKKRVLVSESEEERTETTTTHEFTTRRVVDDRPRKRPSHGVTLVLPAKRKPMTVVLAPKPKVKHMVTREVQTSARELEGQLKVISLKEHEIKKNVVMLKIEPLPQELRVTDFREDITLQPSKHRVEEEEIEILEKTYSKVNVARKDVYHIHDVEIKEEEVPMFEQEFEETETLAKVQFVMKVPKLELETEILIIPVVELHPISNIMVVVKDEVVEEEVHENEETITLIDVEQVMKKREEEYSEITTLITVDQKKELPIEEPIEVEEETPVYVPPPKEEPVEEPIEVEEETPVFAPPERKVIVEEEIIPITETRVMMSQEILEKTPVVYADVGVDTTDLDTVDAIETDLFGIELVRIEMAEVKMETAMKTRIPCHVREEARVTQPEITQEGIDERVTHSADMGQTHLELIQVTCIPYKPFMVNVQVDLFEPGTSDEILPRDGSVSPRMELEMTELADAFDVSSQRLPANVDIVTEVSEPGELGVYDKDMITGMEVNTKDVAEAEKSVADVGDRPESEVQPQRTTVEVAYHESEPHEEEMLEATKDNKKLMLAGKHLQPTGVEQPQRHLVQQQVDQSSLEEKPTEQVSHDVQDGPGAEQVPATQPQGNEVLAAGPGTEQTTELSRFDTSKTDEQTILSQQVPHSEVVRDQPTTAVQEQKLQSETEAVSHAMYQPEDLAESTPGKEQVSVPGKVEKEFIIDVISKDQKPSQTDLQKTIIHTEATSEDVHEPEDLAATTSATNTMTLPSRLYDQFIIEHAKKDQQETTTQEVKEMNASEVAEHTDLETEMIVETAPDQERQMLPGTEEKVRVITKPVKDQLQAETKEQMKRTETETIMLDIHEPEDIAHGDTETQPVYTAGTEERFTIVGKAGKDQQITEIQEQMKRTNNEVVTHDTHEPEDLAPSEDVSQPVKIASTSEGRLIISKANTSRPEAHTKEQREDTEVESNVELLLQAEQIVESLPESLKEQLYGQNYEEFLVEALKKYQQMSETKLVHELVETEAFSGYASLELEVLESITQELMRRALSSATEQIRISALKVQQETQTKEQLANTETEITEQSTHEPEMLAESHPDNVPLQVVPFMDKQFVVDIVSKDQQESNTKEVLESNDAEVATHTLTQSETELVPQTTQESQPATAVSTESQFVISAAGKEQQETETKEQKENTETEVSVVTEAETEMSVEVSCTTEMPIELMPKEEQDVLGQAEGSRLPTNTHEQMEATETEATSQNLVQPEMMAPTSEEKEIISIAGIRNEEFVVEAISKDQEQTITQLLKESENMEVAPATMQETEAELVARFASDQQATELLMVQEKQRVIEPIEQDRLTTETKEQKKTEITEVVTEDICQPELLAETTGQEESVHLATSMDTGKVVDVISKQQQESNTQESKEILAPEVVPEVMSQHESEIAPVTSEESPAIIVARTIEREFVVDITSKDQQATVTQEQKKNTATEIAPETLSQTESEVAPEVQLKVPSIEVMSTSEKRFVVEAINKDRQPTETQEQNKQTETEVAPETMAQPESELAPHTPLQAPSLEMSSVELRELVVDAVGKDRQPTTTQEHKQLAATEVAPESIIPQESELAPSSSDEKPDANLATTAHKPFITDVFEKDQLPTKTKEQTKQTEVEVVPETSLEPAELAPHTLAEKFIQVPLTTQKEFVIDVIGKDRQSTETKEQLTTRTAEVAPETLSQTEVEVAPQTDEKTPSIRITSTAEKEFAITVPLREQKDTVTQEQMDRMATEIAPETLIQPESELAPQVYLNQPVQLVLSSEKGQIIDVVQTAQTEAETKEQRKDQLTEVTSESIHEPESLAECTTDTAPIQVVGVTPEEFVVEVVAKDQQEVTTQEVKEILAPEIAPETMIQPESEIVTQTSSAVKSIQLFRTEQSHFIIDTALRNQEETETKEQRKDTETEVGTQNEPTEEMNAESSVTLPKSIQMLGTEETGEVSDVAIKTLQLTETKEQKKSTETEVTAEDIHQPEMLAPSTTDKKLVQMVPFEDKQFVIEVVLKDQQETKTKEEVQTTETEAATHAMHEPEALAESQGDYVPINVVGVEASQFIVDIVTKDQQETIIKEQLHHKETESTEQATHEPEMLAETTPHNQHITIASQSSEFVIDVVTKDQLTSEIQAVRDLIECHVTSEAFHESEALAETTTSSEPEEIMISLDKAMIVEAIGKDQESVCIDQQFTDELVVEEDKTVIVHAEPNVSETDKIEVWVANKEQQAFETSEQKKQTETESTADHIIQPEDIVPTEADLVMSQPVVGLQQRLVIEATNKEQEMTQTEEQKQESETIIESTTVVVPAKPEVSMEIQLVVDVAETHRQPTETGEQKKSTLTHVITEHMHQPEIIAIATTEKKQMQAVAFEDKQFVVEPIQKVQQETVSQEQKKLTLSQTAPETLPHQPEMLPEIQVEIKPIQVATQEFSVSVEPVEKEQQQTRTEMQKTESETTIESGIDIESAEPTVLEEEHVVVEIVMKHMPQHQIKEQKTVESENIKEEDYEFVESEPLVTKEDLIAIETANKAMQQMLINVQETQTEKTIESDIVIVHEEPNISELEHVAIEMADMVPLQMQADMQESEEPEKITESSLVFIPEEPNITQEQELEIKIITSKQEQTQVKEELEKDIAEDIMVSDIVIIPAEPSVTEEKLIVVELASKAQQQVQINTQETEESEKTLESNILFVPQEPSVLEEKEIVIELASMAQTATQIQLQQTDEIPEDTMESDIVFVTEEPSILEEEQIEVELASMAQTTTQIQLKQTEEVPENIVESEIVFIPEEPSILEEEQIEVEVASMAQTTTQIQLQQTEEVPEHIVESEIVFIPEEPSVLEEEQIEVEVASIVQTATQIQLQQTEEVPENIMESNIILVPAEPSVTEEEHVVIDVAWKQQQQMLIDIQQTEEAEKTMESSIVFIPEEPNITEERYMVTDVAWKEQQLTLAGPLEEAEDVEHVTETSIVVVPVEPSVTEEEHFAVDMAWQEQQETLAIPQEQEEDRYSENSIEFVSQEPDVSQEKQIFIEIVDKEQQETMVVTQETPEEEKYTETAQTVIPISPDVTQEEELLLEIVERMQQEMRVEVQQTQEEGTQDTSVSVESSSPCISEEDWIKVEIAQKDRPTLLVKEQEHKSEKLNESTMMILGIEPKESQQKEFVIEVASIKQQAVLVNPQEAAEERLTETKGLQSQTPSVSHEQLFTIEMAAKQQQETNVEQLGHIQRAEAVIQEKFQPELISLVTEEPEPEDKIIMEEGFVVEATSRQQQETNIGEQESHFNTEGAMDVNGHFLEEEPIVVEEVAPVAMAPKAAKLPVNVQLQELKDHPEYVKRFRAKDVWGEQANVDEAETAEFTGADSATGPKVHLMQREMIVFQPKGHTVMEVEMNVQETVIERRDIYVTNEMMDQDYSRKISTSQLDLTAEDHYDDYEKTVRLPETKRSMYHKEMTAVMTVEVPVPQEILTELDTLSQVDIEYQEELLRQQQLQRETYEMEIRNKLAPIKYIIKLPKQRRYRDVIYMTHLETDLLPEKIMKEKKKKKRSMVTQNIHLQPVTKPVDVEFEIPGDRHIHVLRQEGLVYEDWSIEDFYSTNKMVSETIEIQPEPQMVEVHIDVPKEPSMFYARSEYRAPIQALMEPLEIEFDVPKKVLKESKVLVTGMHAGEVTERETVHRRRKRKNIVESVEIAPKPELRVIEWELPREVTQELQYTSHLETELTQEQIRQQRHLVTHMIQIQPTQPQLPPMEFRLQGDFQQGYRVDQRQRHMHRETRQITQQRTDIVDYELISGVYNEDFREPYEEETTRVELDSSHLGYCYVEMKPPVQINAWPMSDRQIQTDRQIHIERTRVDRHIHSDIQMQSDMIIEIRGSTQQDVDTQIERGVHNVEQLGHSQDVDSQILWDVHRILELGERDSVQSDTTEKVTKTRVTKEDTKEFEESHTIEQYSSDSQVINVKEKTKMKAPHFVKLVEPEVIKAGESAVFRAVVTGSPMPQVTWFWKKSVVKMTSHTHITYEKETGAVTLTIINVRVEDFGIVTCEAVNSMGRATCTANLVVVRKYY